MPECIEKDEIRARAYLTPAFDHHYKHIPVLLHEVVAFLRPQPSGTYVDATLGEGGHAEALLHASAPNGRLIGLDRDTEVLVWARRRLGVYGGRVRIVRRVASELPHVLAEAEVPQVDGVLLDLGVSSYQLEAAERGFSFAQAGPLDMRLDRTEERTAATLVNTLSESELVHLIQRYGEERWARRIARAIIRVRRRAPLQTTTELAALVTQVIPPAVRPARIHPATRTFQALRIAVNQELTMLEATLRGAARCLSEGGRLCVIAYHSLEDRIVKQTFRALEAASIESSFSLRLVTHKPVTVSQLERQANPRSRSAKLRVLERV